MTVAKPPDSINLSLIERVEMRKHQPTLEELAEEEKRNKKREKANLERRQGSEG